MEETKTYYLKKLLEVMRNKKPMIENALELPLAAVAECINDLDARLKALEKKAT